MAFTLKKNETASAGVRRVLSERIASAQEHLKKQGKKSKEAVHEARKDLKKIRSVLRLLRSYLGSATFRRENQRYRDAGRVLSQVRDAHVLEETLEKLMQRFPAELPPSAVATAKEKLAQRISHSEGAVFGDKEILPSLRAALQRGEKSLGGLGLDELSLDEIERGLRKVFREGKSALVAAYKEGTSEAFHEWRKQVKHLRYHLELLEPAWPDSLGQLVAELRKLSDLLGEEHDLFVLGEFLGTSGLQSWIARRQKEIREIVGQAGKRIYAERSRAFAERVLAYLKTWQSVSGKAALAAKRESRADD